MSVPLSVKNKHIRDDNIYMVEETHKYYYIDNMSPEHIQISISGTGFLHLFFEPFDGDACAEQLSKNSKPNSRYYGKSKDDILKMWSEGTMSGTIMHKNIEDFWNGLIGSDETMDKTRFGNFRQIYGWLVKLGLEPFRTEHIIYDIEYDIAGSVDFIAINKKTGKLWIIDWKRCTELRRNSFGGKTGKYVCNSISDCNANHYQIQVNLYRYIIEKNYGYQVEQCVIVNLHPDRITPDILMCEDMQGLIKDMLEYWKINKTELLLLKH